MKISVFGLGYVGCVTAACFARKHDVIGVDIVKEKVDAINKGFAQIKEKNLDNLIKKAVKKKKLSATTNARKAILNSDISFLCIGTPSKKDGSINLDYLIKVCKEIGKILREKKHHIIIIRSTIFPGSSKKLAKIIEKASGKKEGKDFDIAINPEFMREGAAIEDFFAPSFIVIGTKNKKVSKIIKKIYSSVSVKARVFIVDIGVAEMIKYVNNSFHALKVTFTNEIASVCKQLEIDSKKIMEIFCSDKKLNLSSYYMKPGFAYGGSCLPKDLLALKKEAWNLKIKTPVLDVIAKSNFEQINRAIKLIKQQSIPAKRGKNGELKC